MEVLNGLHTISAIDSFDFSTLYTKIPHDQLKSRMSKLINDAFTCRDAKHMEVHKRIHAGAVVHVHLRTMLEFFV